MIKLNRSDLLSALYSQFKALPGGSSGKLELVESIQPVVDISRPSKIPYVDWFSAVYSSSTGGVAKAGAVGVRYVVVYMLLSYRMVATDTGSFVGLSGIINNTSTPLLVHQPVPSVASGATLQAAGEFVFDENTDLTVALAGTVTWIYGTLLGYKMKV